MDHSEAVAFCKWYSKMLRCMKAAGLKVEDMPPDVAEAALALHQKALEAYSIIRTEKKKQKRGRT